MKQLIQLILLVAFGTLQAQNDTVTFKVDMNDYSGPAYTTVNVNGTFNAWCGGCNPMTDANSDGIWEVSLPLTAGTIEYKFTLDGWTGQESFSPGGSCTVTAGGFTNRALTFSGSHTVLPVVCYNSCSACTGIVLSTVDFPITWDDATVNYSTVSFGGNIDSIKPDPTNATNTVLKVDKGLGTQTWAGTTITNGGLANPIPFTIPGANTISVRFWSPDAGAAVLLKVEDKTNGAIFVEAIDTTTVAGGWEILTFDYNNPAPNAAAINTANTYDLVSIFPNFGVDGNTAGAKTYYVDNVVYGTLVNCLPVSGITTVAAYADSVDLSWNGNNGASGTYDIEYGPVGFTAGAGTTIAAHPDSTITITGLMANTDYDVYITANCGTGGIPATVGPTAFSTTLAGPRTITCATGILGSLLTEEFDNATSFTGNIAGGNGTWSYDNNTTGSSNTGPSAPHSGSHYIYMETSSGSTTASMVSPAVDLSAGSQNAELSFWLHAYGATIGTLDVGVSTSATGPFTNVFSYGPGQLQTDELDPWQNIGVNLDAYLGQTIYIEFFYTKGSSFTGDLAIDLVEVKSCLSCLTPATLASSNVMSTSADVTWTSGASNLGSAVEYGPAGFTPGTGTILSTTLDSVNISGLTPITAYDVYVTDSCGAGDISSTAGPISFTTTCAVSVAPFTENFDQSSTPACWGQTAASGGPWNFSTSGLNTNCGSLADNTGNSGNYAWMDQSGTDASVSLVTPVIDISGLTTPFFEFYYAMCGTGYTPANMTMIDYWDGSSWQAGDTLDFATSGWQLIGDTIPSTWTHNGGTFFQVRFRAESGGAGLDFYGDNAIDDVRIYEAPSCAFPLNSATSNVTSTSFDVTWTSNGSASYGVISGISGFDPATAGSLTTTTVDSVNLSSLNPATIYDVYIFSVCGAGDLSDTLGPLTVTTLCPSAFSAPYSTDFENITLGHQASYQNCWTNPSSTTPRWEAEDASGSNENSSSTGPFYDNTNFGTSGGHYMFMETSSGSTGATSELVSPAIDISTLTVPQLDYFVHMYGATMGTLRVYAEDTAGGARTLVDSITGQQQTAGSDAWIKRSIVMTIPSGVYRFVFEGERGSSFTGDISIDDMSVIQAPTCFAPSTLGLASATTTSADVYWTPGNASNWIVEYGPAGFTPGSGTVFASTNDTTTISGLMAASQYDFYVTDSCAPGDLSTTSGPFTFATSICAATNACVYTLNLYDSFGDGWNGGDITVWQAGIPVGTYGANFTTGSSVLGITLNLCDGLPTYVTLSNPGSWSSEMGFDLSNPLGAIQGVHTATGGLGQGDTLSTFTTDCSACPVLTAPYAESFDLGSTPNCWSQEANVGGPWNFSTSGLNTACGGLADNTGNGGNYAWMDQSSTDDSVSLIMPVIDISGLTTPFYQFYYSMCGTGYTPINLTIIEYWDGTSWQTGDTLDFATSGWQLVSDTIAPSWTFNAGTNVQLRFRAESGGASFDFNGDNAIDDVRIYEAPSCFFPSNAAISNVTSTSFDVTWTSNGSASYGVISGLAGFDPATAGALTTTTGDSVNLSSLSPSTTYDVYIYSDCGAGDVSDTLGPLTITTACPVSFTAPYSTDFENITLGHQASYENCWSTLASTTPRWEAEDASGSNENSSSTGPFFDNTTAATAGGTYMFLETSSGSTGATGSLVSPIVDFASLSTPELSFFYHMYGATMGVLRIYAEDATGTLTILDSIVGQQQTAGSDAWIKKSIDLSSLSGTTYNFVFEGERGSSFTGDISIDDFSVAEAPNCSPSSQLSLIAAGNTSADVTWTAGTGTSWDIEYGPAGFTPGTGTTFNATNDTVTISGLMASTAYDFYVTDSCGSANGVATTAGPGSFTTAACALSNQCAYTVDLYDTFGDGWNGGEITILQNGVAVASFGSAFSTGASSLGNTVNLCDNAPTTITLSTAGSWPSEIGVVITNPNGDTAGVHVASGAVGTGDTLISFTSNCSACPAVAAPYFESFEANSPTVGCWTNVFVADSLSWTLGAGSSGGVISSAYAGTQNAVFASASGGPDTTLFVSPIIDMSALISPQLSFWYAQEEWFGDQNITNVYYRASATAPWTFLFGDNTNRNTWTQALVSLPNASSTYQIAIEGINNWGHANVIDSLSITDAALICTAPDSVAAANVTTTGADITWASSSNQSSSWIEYGPLGFTPGTGTLVNPATTPATLSGLMPGTIYEACVYDICSALGDTSSAACVSFTTLCAPITNYPYSENFDLGLIPACYTSVGTTTGSFLWAPDAGGTGTSTSGPAVDNTTGTATGFYLYTEASSPAATGDSAILTLPEFNLSSLTVPEISYFYHMYGADIQRLDLQVYDATSMTWSTIDSIIGQQQSGSSAAWLEARVDLSAYNTSTNLQMRFITVRGPSFAGDVALDDITVRETPACVDPTNLMVTNASGNSIGLSWNSDTNIVASIIEYGPVGFALGTGTQVTGTPNAYTVAGLANGTCYDFYVKDSCTSATAWIGPVTACTIANCSVSSVPVSASSDTTDCDGGSVSLSAVSSSSNDLVWLNNGQAVGTGANYVSDSISFTTAFDVAEFVTTSPVLHVGPLTNIATSGFGNFSNGQWITVNDTVHIDSMVVNHNNDVTAQLVLWTDDSFTNLVSLSDTFTTPAGVTGDLRVPINMVVTPGVYFMNVNFIGGAGQLFRATGGAVYPYNLAGLMSIDSTNFGSQARIYYTFDMTVSKACIGTPIQGFGVVPGANAGLTDTVSVCSTESMVDLTSFLGVYDFGGTWSDLSSTGALTDSIFDATAVASGASYDFSYILAGVNGCAGDTATLNVTVEEAPNAGTDSTFAVCIGSGNLILRPFITGNPFGGTWVDLDNSGALNSTGVWRANVATVGTFRIAYILSGVVCDPDTAILTIMSDLTVSAGMAVSDSVCDDEAMVDLSTFLDASASTGGTWTELTSTGAITANIFDATSVTTNSSYDFQYKVTSACGDDSIVVSLYVDDCDVSVRELNTGFIKIYPNPTSGVIKIEDKSVKGQVQVELYSANGQLMMSKNFGENEAMSLDISDYATGIYTVKVNSEKGLDVKRIMKH